MLSKKNVITITIALTILLIVAMPLILYFTYFGLYLNNAFSKSQEIWGQFGDFISGIYAFFAFLGVLFAVYFQEKQLRTARTQLQLDELKKLISDLSTEIDLILNKELLIEANREASTSLNEININKVSSNQKVWSLREVLPAIGENAILNKKLDAEFKKVYDNIKLDVAQLLIEFKQFPKVFDQYIKVVVVNSLQTFT